MGNLLAFLAGPARRRKAPLFRHPATDAQTTEFSSMPSRPIRFLPGQYMELDLPHAKTDGKGRRRVFSLPARQGSAS